MARMGVLLATNTSEPSKIYEADLENLQDNNITNNIDNNTIPKGIEPKAPESYGNSEINLLFEEWHKNCGFKISSKVKLNRFACNRLLKSKGLDAVLKVLPIVAESNSDKYAPSIANFMDLEEKWNNLAIWYQKRLITKKKSGILVV